MKTQSVLYNYIILLIWEKERASIKFNFLKLNPYSKPILVSPPYVKLKFHTKVGKEFLKTKKIGSQS